MPVPTTPVNPYLTYNFLVRWNGKAVAAVSQVSGLTRSTQVGASDASGQPQSAMRIPGQADFAPVRLSRGITTDPEFEEWCTTVWDFPNTQALGREMSLEAFRKDIQIELYDQAGRLVLRYDVARCWPSEYTALPELETEANTVALASLTLQHEGWTRDTSVVPPA